MSSTVFKQVKVDLLGMKLKIGIWNSAYSALLLISVFLNPRAPAPLLVLRKELGLLSRSCGFQFLLLTYELHDPGQTT